ncbi:IAP-2 [Rachiplusia nu nucleopolyhedrovirus]|uniref:IAP-2 n=1 Tax=Rachiplusia nu nucleopolyhedrovirus TaxID=2605775 RepID=A0AAE6IS61_9ABAC|nr:IAP-2 [Rachiplusia nu nucleopolyhedrovirus]QEI03605.1 IAP-2 [Rachiplusia nu nucleopolyhedrovirus]
MDISKIFRAELMPPQMYHDYDNRLDSFQETLLTNSYKKDLAKSGIYYEPGNGVFKCAFCNLYMLKLNMRTLKYHTYSICPMATSALKSNKTMRTESFKKFKTARKVYGERANELSVNGFYYYGKKTEIRCASCLLTIVKLNKADAIESIHSKYSPDCTIHSPPSAPPVSELDNSNDDIEPDLFKIDKPVSRLYPSLSEPDSDDNENNDSDNIDNCESSSEMTQECKNKDDDDAKLCKICFEREKNTCFLPCKHISTCMICAKKCKICCICRVKVKERLEVYLQ